MTRQVRDVMTADPVTVEPLTSVKAVARLTRDEDIGAVPVTEGERLCGLASDRGLVVRAMTEGGDPARPTVAQACGADLIAVGPETTWTAVRLMRERSVRGVPVVGGERHPVGIVSLGDLSIERDPRSALADVSSARPNRRGPD